MCARRWPCWKTTHKEQCNVSLSHAREKIVRVNACEVRCTVYTSVCVFFEQLPVSHSHDHLLTLTDSGGCLRWNDCPDFCDSGKQVSKTLQKTNTREVMDLNEPQLLVRIPKRDPRLLTQHPEKYFESSDQHMKILMFLREGLHVTMHFCMRQHC